MRGVAFVGALTLLVNALLGVSWSGASWSNGTATALAVVAASDWTPPSVTVSPLAGAVQGTVTVTATASDARSAIDPASVVVEYSSAAGTAAWTAYTGCTRSGTNPVTASCSWNTTLLPDGDYLVRARATDAAGYSTTSATVATTIRNAAGVKLTRLATYLRGTVPVTGTVTSSGGSSTAQVYLERSLSGANTFTQLNGACAAGPVTTLTCQWNTAGVADGTYDVRARAVTTSTYVDVQTGVIIDNTAPTASLSVPAGVLSGNVALNATASDATSGVASVALEYRLAGSSGAYTACSPVTGTYTCNLNTTTLTNGATYDFRAVATDGAGNSTTTALQSRVVDNSPATVAITNPASGAVLGGVTTITVNATSPRGVSTVRVEYRATGTTGWTTACTATAAPYSCTWDTRPLAGSYELRAVAVETYGGAAPVSASVPITINNADGTVTVTQPTAGAVVSGTTTLTASTVSPTGVTSVALQVRKTGATGWTTVCTVTSGPYSCGWATPTEYDTTWQVQAVMTQGNQRTVTSAAVNVTVRNPSGSVAVTSPATGATVRGSSVSLTATATSNAPITAVKFQVTAPNGTVTDCAATGTGPYACTWNTSAITYGSYVITAVMTHGGTTQTSAPVTVTVDNRVVKGVDVQAANGGTAGIPDAGDTLTFTYSSLMNLSSIQSGLTYGGSVAIGTALTGSTGQLGDTLAFPGSNLGSVTVSSNFYSNNKTLTFSGSTITASQGTDAGNPVTVLTVRLGTAGTIPAGESLKSVTTAGTLVWTPSAGATDASGAPSATTPVSESGASDRDF